MLRFGGGNHVSMKEHKNLTKYESNDYSEGIRSAITAANLKGELQVCEAVNYNGYAYKKDSAIVINSSCYRFGVQIGIIRFSIIEPNTDSVNVLVNKMSSNFNTQFHFYELKHEPPQIYQLNQQKGNKTKT